MHLYHNIFPEVHNIQQTQGITFGYVIIKARFKKIEHTSMLLLHTVKVETGRRSSWSALNLHLRQRKPKIFHLETDDGGAEDERQIVLTLTCLTSSFWCKWRLMTEGFFLLFHLYVDVLH